MRRLATLLLFTFSIFIANHGALAGADDDGSVRQRLAALEIATQVLEVQVAGLLVQNGELSELVDTLGTLVSCIQSVQNGEMYIVGCNVHIQNGLGITDSANTRGNLIIGYNELGSTNPESGRAGSHNLVVGPGHTYQSHGGLVAGTNNSLVAPNASVGGGDRNTASGVAASVSGGKENEAGGDAANVSGGRRNDASGLYASVCGGELNQASGRSAGVSGGWRNKASGRYTSASGGRTNDASGQFASVGGGVNNKASGMWSSVMGGQANEASGFFASVSGGSGNEANGSAASVVGGQGNAASGFDASVLGGVQNVASGNRSTVVGDANLVLVDGAVAH